MAIDILLVDEVAELLRIPPNKVVLLARRGEIVSLRIDGKLRFDARDVEDYVNAQRSDRQPMKPPRLINAG